MGWGGEGGVLGWRSRREALRHCGGGFFTGQVSRRDYNSGDEHTGTRAGGGDRLAPKRQDKGFGDMETECPAAKGTQQEEKERTGQNRTGRWEELREAHQGR